MKGKDPVDATALEGQVHMSRKLGVIVNPIAGMGGKMGFKGTDGEEILSECIRLGASPEAPTRAVQALRELLPIRDDIQIVTYPGRMGEDEAREAGFEPIVIGSTPSGRTTFCDTRQAAKDLAQYGVDLILFVGGDGTARDIYSSIRDSVVVLGAPAGVKIHSAVYAINPRRAGELAGLYLQGRVPRTREAEVMDIDEVAFREGRVSAALYGYLMVPHQEVLVQGMKAGRRTSEETHLEDIAFYILDNMRDNAFYILGPGSTTRSIKDKIGSQGTLLGVDVVLNKQYKAKDVNEAELLTLVGSNESYIVVTVIGGQGYIFGRGNQQISNRVIREVGRDRIIVVATRQKMAGLGERPLLVDTGDEEVDCMLCGYIRVVTGYHEQMVARVAM